MLILGRNEDELIRITVPPSDTPQTIDVLVAKIRSAKLGVHCAQVKLGFEAAKTIAINRMELQQKIEAEQRD